MSNKSNGTAFEKEFAQALSEHSFWVHRMQDNANGQPFDVIAARDGITYAFDCKDCQSGAFRLSRIEENQKTAMQLWFECGNHEGLFALRFPEGIRILSYTTAMYLESHDVAAINGRNAAGTMSIEEWVQEL